MTLADGTECFKEQAKGYIEKKIFPKVLKDKLVEEFILNTEPRALGNASARKINYVKVPFTSDNRDYVESVISDFNKEFIYKAGEPADKDHEQVNFDMINYAIIGFDHLNPAHFVDGKPLINVDNSNNDDSDVSDTYSAENASAGTYNYNYYHSMDNNPFIQSFHKIVDVKVLDSSSEVKDVFDIVFIDPPYKLDVYKIKICGKRGVFLPKKSKRAMAKRVKKEKKPARMVERYARATVTSSSFPAPLPRSAIPGAMSPMMRTGMKSPRKLLKMLLNVRKNLTAQSGRNSEHKMPRAMAASTMGRSPSLDFAIIIVLYP